MARTRVDVRVVLNLRGLLRSSGDRAQHVRELGEAGVIACEGQHGFVVADDELAVVTTDPDASRLCRIADADRRRPLDDGGEFTEYRA
jgi:hypothetical protein